MSFKNHSNALPNLNTLGFFSIMHNNVFSDIFGCGSLKPQRNYFLQYEAVSNSSHLI